MTYEEKKKARIERYKKYSENAMKRSQEYDEESDRMASVIPLGQPIQIGHHSEKCDRNYRDRIHKKMNRSCEEYQKSKYWDERAKAAENNKSISSDDPEAIKKLKEKIKKAQDNQLYYKSVNKAVKSKDPKKALEDLGCSSVFITKILEPDFAGRIGIPSYMLQNNNANIKRMQKRLEQLERLSNLETSEKFIGDVRIVENAEENRIQIFFPSIPSEEIRSFMKSNGFRFSKRNGNAWQRQISNRARYLADQVAKMNLKKE